MSQSSEGGRYARVAKSSEAQKVCARCIYDGGIYILGAIYQVNGVTLQVEQRNIREHHT